MKTLLLGLVLIAFLPACSARQQHVSALSDTVFQAKRAYHIKRIQEIDAGLADSHGAPREYSLGFGSFILAKRFED
ncbi:MAG: hypothetical protein KDD64_15580 [Bdellovibrionales bacterium]|nr:hypothetical protein [Bdellovibrionales bacterium]